MPDTEAIPHLLLLLDDDSPVVRSGVARALEAYGDRLPDLLAALPDPPGEAQLLQIRALLAPVLRERLRRRWPERIEPAADIDRLERSLTLLAEFLSGGVRRVSVPGLLDDLTDTYRTRYEDPNPRTLAAFLFRDRGLAGDTWNGEHPDNSNLIHVIETGRGLPITLAAVFILVGHRLGLDITGCNFPAHFLARVRTADGEYFVDCFGGGRFLTRETLLDGNPKVRSAILPILDNPITSDTIMLRVLNNLARSYEAREETENHALMLDLCREIEAYERAQHGGSADPVPGEPHPPRFSSGQTVRHRRYGYRGVIVQVDPECRADEGWYQRNATRPDRNQAWYSVLVDGSDQVTYAAESSLSPDPSGEAVNHPLFPEFFTQNQDGTFHRNDRPWPGW